MPPAVPLSADLHGPQKHLRACPTCSNPTFHGTRAGEEGFVQRQNPLTRQSPTLTLDIRGGHPFQGRLTPFTPNSELLTDLIRGMCHARLAERHPPRFTASWQCVQPQTMYPRNVEVIFVDGALGLKMLRSASVRSGGITILDSLYVKVSTTFVRSDIR